MNTNHVCKPSKCLSDFKESEPSFLSFNLFCDIRVTENDLKMRNELSWFVVYKVS